MDCLQAQDYTEFVKLVWFIKPFVHTNGSKYKIYILCGIVFKVKEST